MQIYPSILEPDSPSLLHTISRYVGHFEKIQVDFVDNILTHGSTIGIDEFIVLVKKNTEVFSKFAYEFHLMVEDFFDYFEKLENSELKISTVLIHVASNKFENHFETFSKLLQEKEIQLGLVLNPQDLIERWKKYIWHVDRVQLMTVIPGKQGSPFLPHVLEKIDQIREMGWKGEIELDGGINEKTLGFIEMRKNLPNIVCPGSWLKNYINIDDFKLKYPSS